MALPLWLREYLDERGVQYTVLPHTKTYTAQQTAASTHVPGWEVAKTVVMKGPEGYALAVIPADHRVDVAAMAQALGSDVRLATEEELQGLFPGCELGAMPPLGDVYRLPVWVAEPLSQDLEIVFNGGSHTDAVRVRYDEYARLVRPQVACISQRLDPPRQDSASF